MDWRASRNDLRSESSGTRHPSRNETHGMRQQDGGWWKTELPREMMMTGMEMLAEGNNTLPVESHFLSGRASKNRSGCVVAAGGWGGREGGAKRRGGGKRKRGPFFCSVGPPTPG